MRTPLHARRHTHVHISECSELFPPAASGFASISMRKPPDHMAHGGLTGTPVVTEGLFDGSLWVFVSTFRQPPAPFLSEQLPTTQVFCKSGAEEFKVLFRVCESLPIRGRWLCLSAVSLSSPLSYPSHFHLCACMCVCVYVCVFW